MDVEKSISEFVDDIARNIPGFSGYYRKEERRENDKRLRREVVKGVEYIEKIIEKKGRKASKEGDFEELDRIGKIGKRIEKLKDSIDYADYGYSGFFDRKEVGEEKLRSVYRADMKLLNWVEKFIEEAGIESEMNWISENIEKGFGILKSRKEIIEGD